MRKIWAMGELCKRSARSLFKGRKVCVQTLLDVVFTDTTTTHGWRKRKGSYIEERGPTYAARSLPQYNSAFATRVLQSTCVCVKGERACARIFKLFRTPGINSTQDWDFFGFDFEICIISLLVMSKYSDFTNKNFWSGHYWGRYDFSPSSLIWD